MNLPLINICQMNGHLDYFHLSEITNNASMNPHVHVQEFQNYNY